MFRAKVLFHFVFLKVVAFLPTEILLLLVGTNSGNENLKYFIICE
jgi:membrane protein DedA with SNARE-associated domain